MPERLKVIIIGPGYPYRNGQSIYLSSLCNQLNGEFKVELINYSMLYPNFLFPGKTQFDSSKDKKVNFPNKRMLNSLNPISWIKTAKYIKKQNPDIIAIDWWHPFLGPCNWGLSFFLSSKLKKKLIFITENMISHEANKIDGIFTKLGLKNAQAFLALSEAVEKQLNTLFNKKIFRSSLPIYDFYQSENIKDQDSLQLKSTFNCKVTDTAFLFFGLVRKYKGLDLLLEAFAELKKTHSDIKLLVIGEFYESPDPYLNLIKRLAIEDDIFLENKYIPNEEVFRYFNASDCVVLPYRSATQSGILSMAYGFRKPVIVTDVGELAALVKQNKTGFVANEVSVINIQKSMEDYLEYKKENFNFEKEIEIYLEEKDDFKNINKVFNDIITFLN